jgi:hypothetical protein
VRSLRVGASRSISCRISGQNNKVAPDAKSASYDVVIDTGQSFHPATEAYNLHMLYGLGPLREKLPSVLTRSIAEAQDFWDCVSTMADLLAAIKLIEQLEKDRGVAEPFAFSTQGWIALAFTHVKLGQMAEARQNLGHWCHHRRVSDANKQKLETLLSEAAT